MMIHIDRATCVGHGRCYTLAPEVYDCDEEGFSILRLGAVEAGDHTAARRGALACPESAITVED